MRALALLACAALLAACGQKTVRPKAPPTLDHKPAPAAKPAKPGSRYSQEHDTAPASPPKDLDAVPQPRPRAEPRSRYGNKSPYTVLGRTYTVRERCTGYRERGIASWYGTKFHGHLTSNREEYDMYLYSAAHKTLPLPCYAKVTNLENGRSVVVRINDRGPFFESRIIDLSYIAAMKLGVNVKGTARVEVETLDPGDGDAREAAAPARAPSRSDPPGREPGPPGAPEPTLFVQAGAFSDADNARRLAVRLERARIGPVRVVRSERDGRALHRVQVGPLASVEAADRTTAELDRLGVTGVVVTVD